MSNIDKERFKRRIIELEAFGHRGSATTNEDRAADYLLNELEAQGIHTTKETFCGYNSLGARILVHIIVALAGLLLIKISPWATAISGLVVIISFTCEMKNQYILLSRILSASSSRNVVARIPPRGKSKPKFRIILCAHIDTQRTGFMWNEHLVRLTINIAAKAKRRVKSPLFPVVFGFWLQSLIGLLSIIWPSNPVSYLLFWPVLAIYIIAGLLLADWSRGKYVPGAADNASGVAGAMEIASIWQVEGPDDVELILLLCGCEETGGLGAASWLETHKKELLRDPTIFIVLDTLAYGSPRFLGKEYTLATTPVRYPEFMLKLCKRVAEKLDLKDAGPHELPVFSDAVAFLSRGIPGISILTFEKGPYMPNYHRLTDTSDNMDFNVGIKAVEFAWALLDEIRLNKEQINHWMRS